MKPRAKKAAKTKAATKPPVKSKPVAKSIEATKLLSIKNVPESTIDEFWRLRDLYEGLEGKTLTAPEVLNLIILNAQKQDGIQLNPGEIITTRAAIKDEINIELDIDREKTQDTISNMVDQINELKSQNETLTAQLQQNQNDHAAAISEMELQAQEYFSTNENLCEQLNDLKAKAQVLNKGEFICKLYDDVRDVAAQVRKYLQDEGIIEYDDTSSYPEALANFCIKEYIELRYSTLLKN